jgi:hypothetical protein
MKVFARAIDYRSSYCEALKKLPAVCTLEGVFLQNVLLLRGDICEDGSRKKPRMREIEIQKATYERQLRAGRFIESVITVYGNYTVHRDSFGLLY